MPLPDASARSFAVDPSQNVVLEASAGTGKTRVLVERYVNLLRAGIEPDRVYYDYHPNTLAAGLFVREEWRLGSE
jgi:ATP-dependent helicase/nuclease subunit A